MFSINTALSDGEQFALVPIGPPSLLQRLSRSFLGDEGTRMKVRA